MPNKPFINKPDLVYDDQTEIVNADQPVDPAVAQVPAPSETVVDESAVDLLDPESVERPVQVQDTSVVYLPKKDFEGRVNQTPYFFKKDVPVKIPRDVANMLLEDPDRGYVKD